MYRMLLAACLSGVALIGTWGSVQVAPTFADYLTEKNEEAAFLAKSEWQELTDDDLATIKSRAGAAREMTQITAAAGAIVGTILAAFLGNWIGRRWSYFLLCAASLASGIGFYKGNDQYDGMFLVSAFLLGGLTASFYGWLPLYLPELFRTSVRATGQGFAFNFGRILGAIGALQLGNLRDLLDGARIFGSVGTGLANACAVICMIYVVGMVIIWFAPETKGKPLPE
jgi:MFS family permease